MEHLRNANFANDSSSRERSDIGMHASTRRNPNPPRISSRSREVEWSLDIERGQAKLPLLWLGQVLFAPVPCREQVRHRQCGGAAHQTTLGCDVLRKLWACGFLRSMGAWHPSAPPPLYFFWFWRRNQSGHRVAWEVNPRSNRRSRPSREVVLMSCIRSVA